MSTYSATVSGATPSTTNDTMTITGASASTPYAQIIEVSVSGMGTASAANELGLFNVTTVGATGSGAITPNKFSPFSVAAVAVINTGWTTQPTVGGELIALGCNSNGGIYRWVARPGEEISLYGNAANGGQYSLRFKNSASAGPVTVHLVWQEQL